MASPAGGTGQPPGGDISSDGTTVHSGGTSTMVPAGAEVYLRAQLTHRRIMGAGPDDPLCADDTGPLRDRMLAAALRAPATEVGVPVSDLATSRAAVLENSRWRQRWGISVQRLR